MNRENIELAVITDKQLTAFEEIDEEISFKGGFHPATITIKVNHKPLDNDMLSPAEKLALNGLISGFIDNLIAVRKEDLEKF